MSIRKITINGNEYEFVNDSRNTRNGFAHDTRLFKDNREIGRATCNYLNRTWEAYTYQTSMKKCINNIVEIRYDKFIEKYKADNNIKRMTEKARTIADAEFYGREDIIELLDVYEELNNRG